MHAQLDVGARQRQCRHRAAGAWVKQRPGLTIKNVQEPRIDRKRCAQVLPVMSKVSNQMIYIADLMAQVGYPQTTR